MNLDLHIVRHELGNNFYIQFAMNWEITFYIQFAMNWKITFYI